MYNFTGIVSILEKRFGIFRFVEFLLQFIHFPSILAIQP